MANLHKKMTFVDDIGNSQNTKGREAEHGEHGVNHTSQGPEKKFHPEPHSLPCLNNETLK